VALVSGACHGPNPLTPTVAMGTTMKHPVPDQVKQSFVIFDIRALWRSARASECADVKNYKWRHNRMLYSCTCVAAVGVNWANVVSPSLPGTQGVFQDLIVEGGDLRWQQFLWFSRKSTDQTAVSGSGTTTLGDRTAISAPTWPNWQWVTFSTLLVRI